ncbi:MAG: LuxR family transcriptional regulator [Clostridiales bacterium]|jgi:DNA-binding NarL/FixJ family response regulator|nr:LuxR family transcriptional regulator [Clostridiales bacterium]
MAIRVIIVDDDRIVRESMGIILSMDKEIEVKGTCSDGDEAFNFCRENNVDVVLMDIRMPICDGVAGTKKIKELNPNINVIILTTFNDDNYISQALKNGASGYLLKNISPDKIMEAIKIVHSGNMLIHPEAAARLAGMLNKREEVNFSNFNLNLGEIEIIKSIADGYTNKEIADRVFLSEGTVKNKISEILSKLGLRDRTQIAIFYLKGR